MTALRRERLDDGIEVLRLDRPQARNALDSAALADLIEWQRTGDGLPRGGLRSR